MVAEWFCQVMGSEVGPLSQRQLVDMVRQHQVNPEDLVRRNKSGWVPAFEVKGLFEAASKPPTQTDPTPQQQDRISTKQPDRRQAIPKVDQKTRSHAPHEPAADLRGKTTPHRAESIPTSDQKHDWFCIASGEKCGPLGFHELKAMAEEGRLRDRDRVWRASWPKFQKAGEIDGLTSQQ